MTIICPSVLLCFVSNCTPLHWAAQQGRRCITFKPDLIHSCYGDQANIKTLPFSQVQDRKKSRAGVTSQCVRNLCCPPIPSAVLSPRLSTCRLCDPPVPSAVHLLLQAIRSHADCKSRLSFCLFCCPPILSAILLSPLLSPCPLCYPSVALGCQKSPLECKSWLFCFLTLASH